MVSIGIEKANDEEDGHPRHQKHAQLQALMAVAEDEIDEHRPDEKEPEEVGDYEKFTKGDKVINTHMDDIILGHDRLLEVSKEIHIYYTKHRENYRVFIFLNRFQKSTSPIHHPRH